MNDQDIQKLQQSFKLIALEKEKFASMFYERLFELALATRHMFPANMVFQEAKIISALSKIVATLRDPQELYDYLSTLGHRHKDYGTVKGHYPVMGDALLWTMQEYLGDGFTPELKALWQKAYKIIADAMMKHG